MFRRTEHVHFVGIGGAGMSGIAEVLLDLGYAVSGSDLVRSATTARLEALGARVFAGHAAAQVAGAHVVVASSAVRADNPELVEARRLAIPVVPRAEMLAELMRLKYGIAVSGSHGKTTTTTMVAQLLDRAGLDPTVIVGGRVAALGSGARRGKGDFMVAEADESDRSFLRLTPAIAVVTNVDREHLDAYRDLADVQQAFVGFANKVPFYGAAILCADDEPTRAIVPRIERRVVSYGLDPTAQVSASDVEAAAAASRYDVVQAGRVLGRVELPVPGIHNVRNSLAAVAVALELGIGFEAIREGLAAFSGVDRRFQTKGEAGGVLLIDDYGHHPTEIRATLETLRALAGQRRRVVLFQPHRFTRTQLLWDEFCDAFAGVDLLLLADIYPASETPIDGVSAQALAEAIRARSAAEVAYVGDVAAAARRLVERVRPGDVVLTLGAGNVHAAGEELLKLLERAH